MELIEGMNIVLIFKTLFYNPDELNNNSNNFTLSFYMRLYLMGFAYPKLHNVQLYLQKNITINATVMLL